jgi:hypothetical protein
MLGSTSNTYTGVNDRSAVTFGAAGEFSKIPSNHPILTVNIIYLIHLDRI